MIETPTRLDSRSLTLEQGALVPDLASALALLGDGLGRHMDGVD